MLMKYKKPARFKENDTVRVRSRTDVLLTLNTQKRLADDLFVDQMLDFCGREFKIQKVVFNYFDERKYRMFKVMEPLYLLAGGFCHGEVEDFEERCDRGCYLLWYEEWLEKV